MNIVVLDGYAANPGDLCWDELQALGECTIYDRTAPAEVLERAAGAEILLTNKTVLTAEHMAALPELKYIGVLATGYNNRRHHCRQRTRNHRHQYSRLQHRLRSPNGLCPHPKHHPSKCNTTLKRCTRGRWTASKDFCFWDTPLIELREKKLGIVGLGHTGFTTARIAIGFGMKVCAYTSKTNFQLPPEIRKMELDELFRECDIISLHCPLTDSTREMVNAERLRLMKPTAILINTGRGPLINEQDLANALNNGTIYAAGVDVLSQEPPRADNPLLSARNCYITPHIAWASTAARERLMQIMLENIKAYQDGKPVNVVNK